MSATLRLKLTFSCAALALAISLCGAAQSQAAGSKSWQPQSWMGDLFSKGDVLLRESAPPVPAPSVTLGRLAIPGSHDSTAYVVNGWADECGDNGFFKKVFGYSTAKRWARTQHYDLYTQARLGVRSFDIRPYWTGYSLRTCHGLDTGPLTDAFTSREPGRSGLEKFIEEHPREVLIINLSHFRPDSSDGPGKYAAGIAATSKFLRTEVCPRAIDPRLVPGEGAGWVTLEQMWKLKKNYVVLVDNENGFYREMIKAGLDGCVFNTNEGVSGGYAGERGSVTYGVEGKRSSTNLWKGMLDDNCYVNGGWGNICKYGPNGREYVDGVRDATEKVLVDEFRQRHRSLDEVSYIWVYGTFAGVTNQNVIFELTELTEATLITATESRRWLVNDEFLNGKSIINGGLLPYARRFIERLDRVSKQSECFPAATTPCYTSVNIVNMDAVGVTDLTRDNFIDPLMRINQSVIR